MPIRSSNATRFIFEENLGRLLPTGSEIGKVLHDKNYPGIYYLKAGNGDPCAGHVNAKCCEAFSWYAARFDFEENFGRELPTGSTNVTRCDLLIKEKNHTMPEMRYPDDGQKIAKHVTNFSFTNCFGCMRKYRTTQ